MIQTRFKLVLAWFKRDEGEITRNWSLIISDSIVIENDSEPRGKLLEVETWLLFFKVLGLIPRYKSMWFKHNSKWNPCDSSLKRDSETWFKSDSETRRELKSLFRLELDVIQAFDRNFSRS